MSEQANCPDCGEALVLRVDFPGGAICHQQGSIECLQRQLAQLRAKNERLSRIVEQGTGAMIEAAAMLEPGNIKTVIGGLEQVAEEMREAAAAQEQTK